MQTIVSRHPEPSTSPKKNIGLYRRIENWASWLAIWAVFWANHKPQNEGRKPKVGGHQASAVSCSSILAALYLHIKRPQDRVAVKPHASPFFYGLMYLMGKLTRDRMENLREFGGLPPYPSHHSDPEIVEYSTSIEGLGPCAVIEDAYEALVQRDQLSRPIDSIYHAVVGDGELTELQIGGSLYEAGRRRLSNVRWWVDLNRQSLDRIMEDSPCGSVAEWAKNLFKANGWDVIDLRWGGRIEAEFKSRGGMSLKDRLDELSDAQYQSLLLVDGGVIRRALTGDTKHNDEHLSRFLTEFHESAQLESREADRLKAFLSRYSDDQLKSLIEDLGGHDLEKLIASSEQASAIHHRPTAILCHTIKGWRMPGWAAHPENHNAIMSLAQMNEYLGLLDMPDGDPWAPPVPGCDEALLLAERASYLFPEVTRRRISYRRDLLPKWNEVRTPLTGERSTSATFGTLNTAYLHSPAGSRMAFVAPDVGLTTHLGGVIAASGVYDSEPGPDLLRFLREKRQTMFNWRLGREGRFHSVAINEGVAALLLFAFGRQKYEVERKEQLFAVGTIYDVFWKHAYSQLYYALYDHARFLAVGTPSGTSLSRESGTHQSIQTPAIIMGLPNIIYYEPAYAFDVKAIYEWALRQMCEPDGEAVYLRLTTQELVQPWGELSQALLDKHDLKRMPSFTDDKNTTEMLRRDVIRGGYWVVNYRREAGFEARANAALIFASGAIMEEAVRASQRLRDENGIYASVCNVTSWERLKRDYEQYWSAPELWEDEGASYHLHDLIPEDELAAPAVIVGDFSPQVAEWVSGALGRQVLVLGPRGFSQSGDVGSIRRYHGIDSEAIVRAVLYEFNPPWRIKS